MLMLMPRVFSLVILMLCLCASENQPPVKQQGVLAMKTATAGTKPCKKCVYTLPLNVATV